MVIFGAGASYDCLTVTPAPSPLRSVNGHVPMWPDQPVPFDIYLDQVRLPLTDHLVAPGYLRDQTLEEHPRAAPLIAMLRDQPNPKRLSFEDRLAVLLTDLGEDRFGEQKVLALRFYLRDLTLRCARLMRSHIGGGVANAYHTCIQTLYQQAIREGRHLCVVTFNYDPLIDYVCSEVGSIQLSDPDSYTADPVMSLLRPHGSALWVHPAPDKAGWTVASLADATQRAMARGRDFDETQFRAFSTEWWRTDTRYWGNNTNSFSVGAPALALPIGGTGKGFVWPASHEAHFRKVLPNVSRLATIGWRGAENHFTSLLNEGQRSQRGLIVVGSDPKNVEAGFILDRVTRFGGNNVSIHNNGFSTLFGGAAWYEWLGQR